MIRLEGDPPYNLVLNTYIGADFVYEFSFDDDAVVASNITALFQVIAPEGAFLASMAGTRSGNVWTFRVESLTSDDWPSRVKFRLYMIVPDQPSNLDILWAFGDIQRVP
ncbi:hypothetical protein AB0E01_23165 [Nocardia vinacea]|uniref:LtfC-like domain-containing protein n=1 Tax=Nocardia vinacea TaxID=96468 RepID=UPI00340D5150